MGTDGTSVAHPLRILVIDDVACRGKTSLDVGFIQAAMRNYFDSLLGSVQRDLIVDFVDTPEKGVARWQNEIYDLTLVDSDFKKSPTAKKEDKDKRSFLDLDVEFVGAYLFRFLCEMLKNDQDADGAHFRDGCKVVLWTGLNANDQGQKERAKRLFSILGDSLTEHSFVPKVGEKIPDWKRVYNSFERDRDKKICCIASIEEVIAEILSNQKKIRRKSSWLARALTWYRTLSPEEFSRAIGHREFVSEGWISYDKNGAFKIDAPGERSQTKGNFYLSSVLRSAGSIEECLSVVLKEPDKAKHDEIVDVRPWTENRVLLTPEKPEHPAFDVIAAATPLTGCSAVGEKHAIKLMVKKIIALLRGPFKQVVLKTVYLDSLHQWDDLHWPSLQAQSHHRTRCLRSTKKPRTLWNTGITALESFTPEMMNDFLLRLLRLQRLYEKDGNCQLTSSVIVSLGSKFPQHNLEDLEAGTSQPLKCYRCHHCPSGKKFDDGACEALKMDLEKIWTTLFGDVFGKTENKKCLNGDGQFQVVEINVRHYLRECVTYHLGGHEYLSPCSIDGAFSGHYADLDKEFGIWLDVLNEVAQSYNKKLLLKLPFRGDVLHWVRIIRDKARTKSGSRIAGITLINAFKSGAGETTAGEMFTPSWYGLPEAWGDANGKQWTYQMSGEALSASRNELLGEVFRLVAESKLEVHVSGGIVDSKGIRYCSPAIVRADCVGCGTCVRSCTSNLIKVIEQRKDDGTCSKRAVVASSACKACGDCVEKCISKSAIYRPKVQVGTWGLMDLNLSRQNWVACSKNPPAIGVGKPRIEECKNCRSCSVHCAHGAFEKQDNDIARIDYGRCVSCKECVDQCARGAVVVGGCRVVSSGSVAVKYEDEKAKRRINPRIAFCLHELCNGCGKCSRTFYCDTFLDRRGLDVPPTMDPRNCTGCGLCVQTCPNGAMQLFEPRHVLVLIADKVDTMEVWHKRLTAYEIPHLTYMKSLVEKNYDKILSRAHDCGGWSKVDDGEKVNWRKLWKYRVEHDFFFDKMSNDYHDDRDGKEDQFKKKLDKLGDADELLKKWLFLVWSDPGQVLKDSPVIYATDIENSQYFDDELKNICGLQNLMKRGSIKDIRQEVNKRLNNLREMR